MTPHAAHAGRPDVFQDAPVTIPDALEYSHELAERVQREADEACAMPWWFWEAAVVIFVGAIAASSIYPWGFA